MTLKDLFRKILHGVFIVSASAFFFSLIIPRHSPASYNPLCFPLAYFSEAFLIAAAISFVLAFVFGRAGGGLSFGLPGISRRLGEGYFLAGMAILCFLFICFFSRQAFESTPYVTDEASYLIQAKTFSSGRLYAAAPVSPEHFCSPMDIVKDGKWYTRYPPGFSLVLALAILLKIPAWMVNPALAALSLVLLYFLGKRLYGIRTAVCACLLGLFSPFFWINSAILICEAMILCCVLLFILFLLKTLESGGWQYPVLSGLSLGAAFLAKPYAALLACLPFMVYFFVSSFKKKSPVFKQVCLFGAGFSVFFLFFLWYNWELTGTPFTLAYNVSNRLFGFKFDYPGFHRVPAPGIYNFEIFTPAIAVEHLVRESFYFNRQLFGWPASLIFIFIPFLFWKKDKRDLLLLSLIVSVVLGYFFYWFGLIRYWYIALPAFFLLTARGIVKMPFLLRKAAVSSGAGRRFTAIFVGVCFAFTLFIFLPSYIKFLREFSFYGKTRMFSAVEEQGIHNAVVFIKAREFGPYSYISDPEQFKYSTAMPFFHPILVAGISRNSPGLQDDILYAVDLGKRNLRLMDHYRDRRFYIYEYNEGAKEDKLSEAYKDGKI